jgi:hypothetical protein
MPLHAACASGYLDIVRELLNYGHSLFDTDAEDKDDGAASTALRFTLLQVFTTTRSRGRR